ncbi:MAG: exodeoxyribonuclease III [Candidatus Nanopelagicales bacterium]
MRIATWNVNGVNPRLPRLLAWLEDVAPDVLGLQELKCPTDQFPFAEVEALGYEVAAYGEGRWNGVALLSRVGLDDVVRGLEGEPQFDGALHPRAVGATCGGLRLWSLYVPNGREPDNPHFGYKLEWLDRLHDVAQHELAAGDGRPFALVGDFNVAPTDADVWDPADFVGATHVTPQERAKISELEALGLVDVPARALKGEPFTFWDYRDGNFHKGKGMRIDLVLGNEPFARAVTDAYVDREARKGKGPSDHAPIVVDLDIDSSAGAA